MKKPKVKVYNSILHLNKGVILDSLVEFPDRNE